jgi:hypothetical protein
VIIFPVVWHPACTEFSVIRYIVDHAVHTTSNPITGLDRP